MSDLAGSTYVPGGWVAVTAPGGWLLVDLPPEDPAVQRCWKLLSEQADADAVLDVLAVGGIAGAPAFALVQAVDLGVTRVIARYPATVVVHGATAGADRTVESVLGVSWHDVLLDERPDAIALVGAPAPATSVELPMGAGVTSAAVVTVSALRPAPAAASAGADRPAQAEASEPASAAGPPAVPAPVAPGPTTEDIAAAETVDTAETPQRGETPAPAGVFEPVGAPEQWSPQTPPGATPVATPADEQLPSYDFLFGATQRGIVGASEQPTAPPTAPASEHTATWPTELPTPAGPPPVPPSGKLIDSVPWDAPTPPAPASAPPSAAPVPPSGVVTPAPRPVDEAPPLVAQTINRAKLRAATVGPTVLAGHCANGHLSPVHAPACRVCGAPMPQQDPVEIARPPLGTLRAGGSVMVTLDKGVLLGRAPDVPAGDDPPHVLRLRSPENDISRNHAEIVIDGWSVYVRDLGSTNGTVVGLPGQPPLRLRENDLQLLSPGSTVTLADEVTLTFEVTA